MQSRVYIVGTAHVSQKSVEEVRKVIREVQPKAVAVELDEKRFRALMGEKQEINVVDVVKRGDISTFLLTVFLSFLQKKLGEEKGLTPGTEMLAAIEEAKNVGADVLLIDRDLGITMRRFLDSLSFFEKIKLFFHFVKGMFEDVDVDELIEKDLTEILVEEFRRVSPNAAKVLVDERDAFMAYNLIRAAERYEKIVAVVGAGHKKGIERYLSKPEEIPSIPELLKVKKKRFSLAKAIGFAVTALFLLIFVTIALTLGLSEAREIFVIWFLINGVLSALFTLLAGGHVFSAFVAFLVAWLTSLNPLIAAGWFAGLAEAYIRKPTADDLYELTKAESLKQLMRNKAFRVIFVAAMANVGSMIGTFLGLWIIWEKYGVNVKEVIQALILSGLNPFLISKSLTF
ncbi:TraB family protein [Ferroglobus placidus DSM 10642]|uniref:TraB family protein n=1 Tax=Ferroglobus placidus (strain DSM 10642 / AEDII12DO) TaxID=589924 RepID=D3S1N9_FERPA|nr:TraB/GumN family protein [Ferroglobus placidus]ADC64346.1 TraB family protein [Ferroglobus placidus DSM 10642]